MPYQKHDNKRDDNCAQLTGRHVKDDAVSVLLFLNTISNTTDLSEVSYR